jgi:hypothetical protein
MKTIKLVLSRDRPWSGTGCRSRQVAEERDRLDGAAVILVESPPMPTISPSSTVIVVSISRLLRMRSTSARHRPAIELTSCAAPA